MPTAGRPFLKLVLVAAAAVVVSTTLVAGCAVIEYRTNILTAALGDWLFRTNSLRPAEGNLWEQIQARDQTKAGLGHASQVELPRQGLPDIVRRNRFGYSRAPETGSAGYAVVWMTPLSQSVESRPIHDILQSYRNYKIGLAILEEAHIPDARFRLSALAEAAKLSASLSASSTPDSTQEQLVEELTRDITGRLRGQEQEHLLKAYRLGEISQIELQQALGNYEGIVTFFNDQQPLRFTLNIPNASGLLPPLRARNEISAVLFSKVNLRSERGL